MSPDIRNRLGKLRLRIAEMVFSSGEGHIPSSFSIVDIVFAFYHSILRVNPKSPTADDRDFFVLSKGHGAAALFAVLEEFGFISAEEVAKYSTAEGILGGHPDSTRVPGVEFSTGSLGHGLPMAVGVAFGQKILGKPNRVLALLGDGECHEGTVWEAANVAANLALTNLTVVVDWNGSGAQLLYIDDLPMKWKSFGWDVSVIDGHDYESIVQSVTGTGEPLKPRVVLAKTEKGHGAMTVTGHGKWHHRIPNKDEFAQICSEIEETYLA